jgi:GNAT superfamily N-acetyltransferase
MNDTLAAALAFDRAMRARAAQRTVRLDNGLVVLHDELPMLHHLNAVVLDAPLPEAIDPAGLSALADAHLGHLSHRHVVLDDAESAERLAPSLLDAGWTRDRVVYMEWRGDRSDPPEAAAAHELTGAEAESLELQILTEDAPRDGAVAAALARQLIAGQLAIRAHTPSRTFGAFVNGAPVSSATLFGGDEGLATIDEVATLRSHRERGHARAAIVAALRAALEIDADPIIVPADADDWPQLIYAKLGFVPIGRQVAFTRTLGSART